MEKIRSAVLGATGLVGQAFLWILSGHPWFEPVAISASSRSEGKLYGEEAVWRLPFQMPKSISAMRLSSAEVEPMRQNEVEVVFSALPSIAASKAEPLMREAGYPVFSNASAMRYEADVPIVVPEINPGDIDMIESQGFPEKGCIIANPNCTTTGLAVALAPLRPFGMKRVVVSTYQALSGAGHTGFTDAGLHENTVPWIEGEEEKISKELVEILKIDPAIYTFCVRVPVPFGHLETVWVDLEEDPNPEDIINAWDGFIPGGPELPSLPDKPVVYLGHGSYPHARMSFEGTPPGMQVFTGRMKKENGMIGFVVLSNNIIRGAAGGSVENAELFIRKYKDIS